jgi:D-glucuronyl C5-epimerase C-terminus
VSVLRTPVAAVLAVLLLLPATALAKGPTPRGELNRLAAANAIVPEQATAWRADYDAAQATLKKLHGVRLTELKAVVENVNAFAARHRFSPSRLPAIFMTLRRNRDWWAAKPLPRAGQRASFAPSQLVWQYYPGQGWQIQWLATFGKANALWSFTGKDDELRRLLDEALTYATQRAGGIAFEYLFRFDGGSPPWVSGLAQGTGLSAFSRGAVRLGSARYFDAARQALGIFRTKPPEGVRYTRSTGVHYLQYSFAPTLRIVNGFTQALNGLHDFAALANDEGGQTLFASGERELRHELPQFDTGAWSLYSKPGAESDLGYHKVLRDFLTGLCDRLTKAGSPSPKPYCATARRFTADLTARPTFRIKVPKKRPRAGSRVTIRITLDKVSSVSVTVTRAGKVVSSTSGRWAHGAHTLRLTPSRPGTLTIRATAVDLAGNAGAEQATLKVAAVPKAKKKKHPHAKPKAGKD